VSIYMLQIKSKFHTVLDKRKKTSESTEEIDTTEDVSPSKDVDADYQAPIARSTESHQSNPSTRASASGSVYQSLPPYPDLADCNYFILLIRFSFLKNIYISRSILVVRSTIL
jgi:hypothetical protein